MVSKEFASKQRAHISDTQTVPPEYYGSDYFAPPTPGTTHLSALDNNGFAAAFLDAEAKALYLAEVDAFFENH